MGVGGYDDLYCSYYVRFAPGFDYVKGGELPGLAGGAANTGGNKPTGRDGWSARMMWRTGGEVVQYVYHVDQPTHLRRRLPVGHGRPAGLPPRHVAPCRAPRRDQHAGTARRHRAGLVRRGAGTRPSRRPLPRRGRLRHRRVLLQHLLRWQRSDVGCHERRTRFLRSVRGRHRARRPRQAGVHLHFAKNSASASQSFADVRPDVENTTTPSTSCPRTRSSVVVSFCGG